MKNKIYKVYIFSSAKEYYFSTRKKVDVFLKEFYNEYKSYEPDPLSYYEFLKSEGCEVRQVVVEQLQK